MEMVFVWKQNYILVDEYFFFCCTWIVNSAVKTVAASLRRQGLRAKASRKFSPVSYRAHGLPVSENL
ncbi:hypothetical protein, partial [Escherichia coli]|uniref:hypothetical protein n=1 Tax=Escherichia coli TaxID=562 RepID=UPI001C7D47DF